MIDARRKRAQVRGIGKGAPGEKCERRHQGGDKYGLLERGAGVLLLLRVDGHGPGRNGRPEGVGSGDGDLWSPGGETWSWRLGAHFAT